MNSNKTYCSNLNKTHLETLQLIQHIVFSLNEENIVSSVETIINLFDSHFPYSSKIILTELLCSSYVSQNKDPSIYINFLNEIKGKTKIKEEKHDIVTLFTKKLIAKNTYFLINEMVKQQLIEPKVTTNISLYFAHYMSEEQLNNKLKSNSFFLKNIDKLREDNWKLHKKYINDGTNSKLAKIILDDNVEKLQEISTEANFDFDQKIHISLYEKHPFIFGCFKVSLIKYAAIFGSIKCFKFLLLNGSKIRNVGLYAVLSGNIEIIHLCKENGAKFEGSLKTAIEYHQNEIFKYLFENKIEEFELDLTELGNVCIYFNNYELLQYLIDKGMEINEYIINISARYGKIFLILDFIKDKKIPENILVFSVFSNFEVFKYFFEKNGININAKSIYLFYLIYIIIT